MLEPSFPTIAGADAHGAIIHYSATAASAADVTLGSTLLLDSGGQYVDGTTDVTRTVHLCDTAAGARPPATLRAAFTRVLQGNIAIDTAVFPEGTPGCAIDAFARRALWAAGMDYTHGTGHGVGAALNVHEGPQSISRRWDVVQPLCEGMVLSNEPGCVVTYGIRPLSC